MSKEKALENLLEEMQEDGLPVQKGGFEVRAIPTGITSFDHSTGVGGFPRGRICVIQGEEGSGKTLLLLALIANVQNNGGTAAFVDLEHALTPGFAKLLGVEYDDLVVSRPRTLDEAYDVSRKLASSGYFDVVGFDSAVALATEAELKKAASESGRRASKASIHSKELPKIVSEVHENTVFIIINQLREDPNPPPGWNGKKLYSPGGRAMRHHSSLTVDVDTSKVYYDDDKNRIGHKTKTYIAKNKVAQPFRRAEFDLFYEAGVDMLSDLVTTAIRLDIVEQRGAWFYVEVVDEETGEIIKNKYHGRANLQEAIKNDHDLKSYINNQIKEEQTVEVEDKEDKDV